VKDARELRKRLDALNRGPLPPEKEESAVTEEVRRALRRLRERRREQPERPLLYRRDLPRTTPARAVEPPPCREPVPLEHAVPGVELHVPRRGRAYLVEERPAESAEEFCKLCERFRRALEHPGSQRRGELAELCPPHGPAPSELLFLDLETTGLGSTPLFLVGTMQWEGGEFVVRQYLARDYSEEAAVIALAAESLAEKRLLVTFNGKSFDMPYLRTRAAANAVPLGSDPPHFDLLHASRRTWRGVLPDCRLQTLESRVCRRLRHGDIAGKDIPAAYHAFVRTGNAAVIAEILRHNMLDLATMADLMLRLPAVSG